MTEQWIVIPNWDRFQHYKDRVPLWIKVYTELAYSPEWRRLALQQRGLLVTLWVEFALSRGQVDTSRARAITGLRNLNQSLKPLIQAGFVEVVAIKPLALTRSREVEVEVEKKKTGTRANQELAPVFQEEEPPPRDPEALTKILGLADRIGKPL